MNTPDAAKLIRKMREEGCDEIFVGAGTVLTLSDLHLALDSGATFIVSPILVKEVVEYWQTMQGIRILRTRVKLFSKQEPRLGNIMVARLF